MTERGLPRDQAIRSMIRRGLSRGELMGVVWDWGDTLMRDIPGQKGPMATWPRVEAMPGAHLAIEALSCCPVQCVATNATDSDAALVAEALGRVGLRDGLTHFFTSRELGASKPDPAFFREASRRLGVPPSRLVAVGNDYGKDIVPAKGAGLVTVLVPLAEAPVVANAESHRAADLIVANLVELAELLREGSGRARL